MNIRDDRRALHRIPELDKNLPETFAYLNGVLSELPCRVFSPVDGSMCAFFDFGRNAAMLSGRTRTPCPSPRKPGPTTLPGTMAACTPADTTDTWRFCWSWPAA